LDGLRGGTIEIAVSYNLNLEADVSFRGVRSFPLRDPIAPAPLKQNTRLNLKARRTSR